MGISESGEVEKITLQELAETAEEMQISENYHLAIQSYIIQEMGHPSLQGESCNQQTFPQTPIYGAVFAGFEQGRFTPPTDEAIRTYVDNQTKLPPLVDLPEERLGHIRRQMEQRLREQAHASRYKQLCSRKWIIPDPTWFENLPEGASPALRSLAFQVQAGRDVFLIDSTNAVLRNYLRAMSIVPTACTFQQFVALCQSPEKPVTIFADPQALPLETTGRKAPDLTSHKALAVALQSREYTDERILALLQRVHEETGSPKRLRILDVGGGTGRALWQIARMNRNSLRTHTVNHTLEDGPVRHDVDEIFFGPPEFMPKSWRNSMHLVICNNITTDDLYPGIVLRNIVETLAPGGEAFLRLQLSITLQMFLHMIEEETQPDVVANLHESLAWLQRETEKGNLTVTAYKEPLKMSGLDTDRSSARHPESATTVAGVEAHQERGYGEEDTAALDPATWDFRKYYEWRQLLKAYGEKHKSLLGCTEQTPLHVPRYQEYMPAVCVRIKKPNPIASTATRTRKSAFKVVG